MADTIETGAPSPLLEARRRPWPAFEYWRDGVYGKWPASYWCQDRHETVRSLKALTAVGLLPALTDRARVCEIGCNIGQNLAAIQAEWGAHCTGLDISDKAIAAVPSEWRRRVPTLTVPCLVHGNVLSSAWFAAVPDGHFDLVFTRWMLSHLPRAIKGHVITAMQRVGRAVLAIEGYDPQREDFELAVPHEPGHWVSLEPLDRYGLAWVPAITLNRHSRVYFARRDSSNG